MTCRALRSRFLPWTWGRVEIKMRRRYGSVSDCDTAAKKLTSLTNYLHADKFMAASVTYFRTLFDPRFELIRAP